MRTSEPGFEQNTLNPYEICGFEIQAGDRLGYKVIAVIDDAGLFWTAYRGPTGWTDKRVAAEGDAVSEEVAALLFPTIAALPSLQYYS